MGLRSKDKTTSSTTREIDDFLYELLDDGPPTLELGNKLLNALGNEREEVLADAPNKKDEEDTILQDIIDEYNNPDMKIRWTKLEKYLKISIFLTKEKAKVLLKL